MGCAACPPKHDLAVAVVTDESFGGEPAAFDVAGKVAQSGAPCAYVSEIHVPLSLG